MCDFELSKQIVESLNIEILENNSISKENFEKILNIEEIPEKYKGLISLYHMKDMLSRLMVE